MQLRIDWGSMSVEVWIGLALALVGGVMAGNCMLPSKFIRFWQWENMWLIFSLVSLVILPWGLALTLVPDLGSVYASLSPGQFAVPVLFGAGWGIAQVLFGLSIARLGMALGYSIIIGLGALLGTLVPLFFQNREVLGTAKGALILAGVAVMVSGVVVSGWAGRKRETAGKKTAQALGGSYTTALVIAVVCGIMAPMLNYAFAFGQDIAKEAVKHGVSAANAGYAVWPVGLGGGLIPNVAYSMYLLSSNKTWDRFRRWPPDVFFSCAMAVLWMGAMSVYGMGTAYLGKLGTSVGWALFQIFMIMTANGLGVLTGEWKTAPVRAFRGLWAGLALLAAATAMIAIANAV
jgi:L-rhamnose-H+ transport protein